MKLSLDDMALIYIEQLFLEFSVEEREKVWQEIQNAGYCNAAAHWNAYLNCLCLNTFLSYLEAEERLHPLPWTSGEDLPSFWQIVNGTAIEVGASRLVLIPSEIGIGTNELRVPREWVDIPQWAGNYYLALELNLEACWLRVSGYATYRQVKEEGKWDRLDETYSLEAEELTEDLSVMWAARELYPNRRPECQLLPTLTTSKATALLEKLSQPSPFLPRLEVPFEQWAALVGEDRWRRELYQLQRRQVKTARSPESSINIKHWFEGVFEAGWQSLNTLLNTESELAWCFRKRNVEPTQLAVKGVKLVDLGIELGNQKVALYIGIGLIVERAEVRVQLHPVGRETYLPPKINLALLSRSGKILQECTSRTQDNFIQLKRFICPIGKGFTIRIAFDEFSFTEEFVIELPKS